jgi:hypothetical protein
MSYAHGGKVISISPHSGRLKSLQDLLIRKKGHEYVKIVHHLSVSYPHNHPSFWMLRNVVCRCDSGTCQSATTTPVNTWRGSIRNISDFCVLGETPSYFPNMLAVNFDFSRF